MVCKITKIIFEYPENVNNHEISEEKIQPTIVITINIPTITKLFHKTIHQPTKELNK